MKNSILLLFVLLFSLSHSQNLTIDQSFDLEGSPYNFRRHRDFSESYTTMLKDFEIQNDDKIIVVGDFDRFKNTPVKGIVRLLPNGNRDLSFNLDGLNGHISLPTKVFIQSSGKIIVYGNNKLVRLNNDGSLDSSFTIQNFSGITIDCVVLFDDKILVGGQEYPNHFLKLYNSNGEIDNNFVFNYNEPSPQRVMDIKTLPNGKILILTLFNIIKINSNGSIDNNFTQINTDHDGDTYRINKIYSDLYGNIIATEAGGYENDIFRYNENGIIDNTFNNIYSTPRPVRDIIAIEGKIIIGGDFSKVNDSYSNALAFLSNSGVITNYPPNLLTGNRGLRKIKMQGNKLLIMYSNLFGPDENMGTNIIIDGIQGFSRINIGNLNTLDYTTYELKAYPNPTKDILNLENKYNSTVAEIFDLSGKLILKTNFQPNDKMVSIDVRSLPKGVYVCVIGSSKAKFIKE